MKKHLLLLSFLSTSFLAFPQTCDSLFSSCIGTFSRQGYYFDLEATNQVEIRGFSVMAQNPGARDIAVYYRTGTYLGNEGNSGAWTLLGTAVNISPSTNATCPIPTTRLNVPLSVCIPQGQRYGFYVVMTTGAGSLESHSNLTEGSTGASDANLILITGKGQQGVGAFAGTLMGGLTYQGGIQYSCTCQPTGEVELQMPDAISVFPVPASEMLGISISGLKNETHVTVELMDISGKRVGAHSLIANPSATLSINIAEMEEGYYVARVIFPGGESRHVPFVKQ